MKTIGKFRWIVAPRPTSAIWLLALCAGALRAGAQTYTNLHEFTSGPSDGTIPFGSLSLNGSTFYGMTTGGGASGAGIVFSVNADGTGYNIIHSFRGGAGDGAHGPGALLASAEV
jgi:uncharacterized repeat protein (TIGR03803 family)